MTAKAELVSMEVMPLAVTVEAGDPMTNTVELSTATPPGPMLTVCPLTTVVVGFVPGPMA